MTITTEDVDMKLYGKLLAKAAPMVIKTEAENDRLLGIVEGLLAKGEDHLSPEEDALLELLSGLIHDYESRAYPIGKSAPHEMIRFLMEQRKLTASDLSPVLGSKGRVSEILSAKRAVSKEQARKLAAFFRVSVALFI